MVRAASGAAGTRVETLGGHKVCQIGADISVGNPDDIRSRVTMNNVVARTVILTAIPSLVTPPLLFLPLLFVPLQMRRLRSLSRKNARL
jgi:hypothetical protein